MATEDNLKAAFAGESQANRKYLAFSQKAEQEGFSNIAKLFRVAAESETVHALRHFRALKAVKTTVDNLKTAIDGETYEHSDMYPKFIAEAQKENAPMDAVYSLMGANEAEKAHAKMFQNALQSVEKKQDIVTKDYFVCETCGWTAEGEAPDRCPVCGALKEQFKKIE